MQNLQFTSVEQFKKYSGKVAIQLGNIKLNSLRDAMAAAEGYSSIASYCTAIEHQQDDLVRFIDDEPIFLTNGLLEDTGHISANVLFDMQLEYQRNADYGNGGFYPLTKVEEQLLSDDCLQIPVVGNISMGYSALYNKTKYVAICFEVDFFDTNSQLEAKEYYESLKPVLVSVARNFAQALIRHPNDVAVEYHDGTGHFDCEIYIPFSTALDIASDYIEWTNHLVHVFCAVHAGNGHTVPLTENEIDSGIRDAGKCHFIKGGSKEHSPFDTHSLVNHTWLQEWLSGWLDGFVDVKMAKYETKLQSLSEQQQDDLTEYLDDLIHDYHDMKASRYNPHDPDHEVEAHEDFISTQSNEASRINNRGHEAQLMFLLAHNFENKINDIFASL